MHACVKLMILLLAGLLVCSWSAAGEGVPVSDGLIGDDEYAHTEEFDNGNYVLYWTVTDESIMMAIAGKTTGWVGIGLKPTAMMKDADIILAGIADEKPYWVDSFSTGNFGPHPADTELGGTDDVVNITVVEKDGITVAEFSRKLDTGDTFDALLAVGEEVPIIWAMATDDDPAMKHNTPKGRGTMTL